MVSFIVPAHNEEQLLGRTLSAIKAAGRALGRPYEVIVANDASTDGTAAVAAEHGATVVDVACRQIAGSRNAGARASAGHTFIFVDADTIVTSQAVAAAVAAIEDGAVGGGCRFRFDGVVPLYGRALTAGAPFIYHLFGLAAGCFIFCTRKAFNAVGGFNERLFAAEEVDISRKLGAHGRFVLLREIVITSGRKLRSHSGREIFDTLRRFLLSGPKMLGNRAQLSIWYAERRLDPAPESESPPLLQSR